MAEMPAVALLFEDVALGDQLRSALQERGARIVHEGGLATLSREQLEALAADVVVVNLEDGDDDALDTLYDMIDGDRPRVVFNDAQASRKLEGWDRARWARHLAVKVLADGDIDPPRPADALSYIPAAALPASDAMAASPEPAHDVVAHDDEGDSTEQTVAASETLAAELEALLAAGDSPEVSDDFGSGLNYSAGDGQRVDDQAFAEALSQPPAADDEESAAASEPAQPLPENDGEADAPPSSNESSDIPTGTEAVSAADGALELAPAGEPWVADALTQADAVPAAAFVAPRSPDSWSLVDPDGEAADASPAPREEASAFGIEKVSAADYLAPEAGEGEESPIVLGMSLELVSMEEAVAPKAFEGPQSSNEMMLDEPTGAAGRLVVLGATTEGTHAVCEFLAALPAGLQLTFLHTQHLSGKAADGLVEHLAEHCALPVRLAVAGRRTVPGEILVAPSDRQVRILRDGTVLLDPVQANGSQTPSIDANFTSAAGTFGRDTVAIVFAGHSTDAFGGCQAVHDRGGQVWVQQNPGGHSGDMVAAIEAEHLSHYAGTPQQLAARLTEQFSKEVRP